MIFLNSAEAKLRVLASGDATLQTFFGVAPFRWFLVREQPGYIDKGTCIRVRRVSAVYTYAQDGILANENVRIQFDVLDMDQERARNALTALEQWLTTVDLMSGAQFASPPSTPPQFPIFRLSERCTVEVQIKQQQVWIWSADYRIMNNLGVS